MDSLVAFAARSLAAGDPLGALKRIALRDDPPALALRGIAMAQLGDYERARELLRRAARGFGLSERLERARCVAAEAEVALAARDLRWPARALAAAARSLEALGDRANALHARLVGVRRSVLLGRLDEGEAALAALDTNGAPAPLAALFELSRAEIALRRVRAKEAERFLARSHAAALAARIPALVAEVERAQRALSSPSARLIRGASVTQVTLEEVEALFASDDLIVDACRRAVRARGSSVSLASRPVLFEIVRALAEAWPGDVPREALIARAFEARSPNESHRARLRVEVGRVRAARASRGACGGGARASDRRTRGVDPGTARGRRALVHLRARVRPRREPADGAARPSRPRRVQGSASGGSRALSALGRAAAHRIRDNLVAPRGAAGALTLTLP